METNMVKVVSRRPHVQALIAREEHFRAMALDPGTTLGRTLGTGPGLPVTEGYMPQVRRMDSQEIIGVSIVWSTTRGVTPGGIQYTQRTGVRSDAIGPTFGMVHYHNPITGESWAERY